MRLIKRTMAVFACALALLSTPSALAGYINYNYVGQPLSWQSAVAYYTIELGPPPADFELPFFQFSFQLLDTLLSPTAPTRVEVLNPLVHIGPGDWDHRINTAVKGNVTVNPDGSVLAWDIDLHLTEKIVNPAHAAIIRATRNNMTIFTSGGVNSCNCDLMRVRSNVVTERSGYYIPIGPEEFIYSDPNSFNYWSVTKVAEPALGSLILIGLGLLGLRQIRRSNRAS